MKANILRIVGVLLAAALVFGAAKGLDKYYGRHTVETQPQATQLWETEPAQTEPSTQPTVEPATESTAEPATEPEPQQTVFTLSFVGDCTLGSAPNHYYADTGFIKTVGEDYGYPFRNFASLFESDDFTMVNLESVMTSEGYPASKSFVFKGPPEYINILTEGSVEAVTLANNHTLDYGQTGYQSTKDLLDGAQIAYVEKDASSIMTTESGLTIGLYAASFVVDQEDLAQEVAALREQGAELVIFAIHWGTEGSYRVSTYQRQLAYDAIDAGVDIVYGSHPHVLQPIEEYNGGVIYFSMGNFSFGGHHDPGDYDTAVLQQQVIREADGTITLGARTIIPANVSSAERGNNFQPAPYEEGSEDYQQVLDKLSGAWKGYDLKIEY